jgi:hypothetical protein
VTEFANVNAFTAAPVHDVEETGGNAGWVGRVRVSWMGGLRRRYCNALGV